MQRFGKRLFRILFLLTIVFVPAALGQLTEIENKLPKNVPLKIEFKNYDKENWLRDLEIKVTNTGNKPIYYLALTLWLDATYPENLGPGSGKQQVISFEFGDLRKFYSTEGKYLAGLDDPAINPGDFYVFTVPENTLKNRELLEQRADFRDPQRGELEHSFTNFGDGTGILKGGTPFSKKKDDI